MAAGTISHTVRGVFNLLTRSLSEPDGTAPSFAISSTGFGDLLNTTHSWPPFNSLRTMLAPIRPRPTIPICMCDPSIPASVIRRGRARKVFTTTVPRGDSAQSQAPSLRHEQLSVAPEVDHNRDVDDEDENPNRMHRARDLVHLNWNERAGGGDRQPARPRLAQIQRDAFRTHQAGKTEGCQRERRLLRGRQTVREHER